MFAACMHATSLYGAIIRLAHVVFYLSFDLTYVFSI